MDGSLHDKSKLRTLVGAELPKAWILHCLFVKHNFPPTHIHVCTHAHIYTHMHTQNNTPCTLTLCSGIQQARSVFDILLLRIIGEFMGLSLFMMSQTRQVMKHCCFRHHYVHVCCYCQILFLSQQLCKCRNECTIVPKSSPWWTGTCTYAQRTL